MAKLSVGLSYTINFVDRTVQYGKIEARIDDIDLDVDNPDEQLSNFDESFDKVCQKLKEGLARRIKQQ